MRVSTIGFLTGEAFQNIRKNGLMSVISVITVTLALLIFALFLVLAYNLDFVIGGIEDQVEIRVYLKEDLDQQGIDALEATLNANRDIASAQFVSRQEAMEMLRQQFADKAGVLAGLEDMNPLPDSFAIRVTDPETADGVASWLEGLYGVDEVVYKSDVIDKLVVLAQYLRMGALGALAILGVATLLIIGNTIRLTVHARRREVEIMKLVGATNAFIRWPFVLEGILLGVIGSAISFGGIYFGYQWLLGAVARYLPFMPLAPASPYILHLAGALIGTGFLIGALGSSLSLRRYLRV